jgi:4-amino-4-deoxy-L-arabinose transferase-like glycosyltransferase
MIGLRKSRIRISLGLFLLFLLLRLFLSAFIFQSPHNSFYDDSPGYELPALDLLKNGHFGTDDDEVLRTPGYPAFIAGVYAIFGQVPGFVVLVQLVVSGLTGLLVFCIGKRVFSEGVGVLGGYVYAISPNVALSALSILTETVYTFFLLLALFFAIGISRTRSYLLLAMSGLCLGLSALVRPISLYLVPLWVAVLVLESLKSGAPFARSLKQVALFILGFIIIVFPWMFRNYGLLSRFTLSTVDAYTLFYYSATATVAENEGLTLDKAEETLLARLQAEPGYDQTDSRNRVYVAARYALRIVLQHPLSYVKAHIRGTVLTLLAPSWTDWTRLSGIGTRGSGAILKFLALDFQGGLSRLMDMASSAGWFAVILPVAELLYVLFRYLFAIFGVVVLIREGYSPHRSFLLLVLTISYLLLLPGPDWSVRFRVPAEPMLSVLAAGGIVHGWKWRGNQL